MLAATAPSDATLVVVHSAVLSYVPGEVREWFVEMVTGLPGHDVGRSVVGVELRDRQMLNMAVLVPKTLAAMRCMKAAFDE